MPEEDAAVADGETETESSSSSSSSSSLRGCLLACLVACLVDSDLRGMGAAGTGTTRRGRWLAEGVATSWGSMANEGWPKVGMAELYGEDEADRPAGECPALSGGVLGMPDE